MADSQHPPPSERATVRRLPERGQYDPKVIREILDEGFLCHVGVAHEGQPFVLPMGYARDGDWLYLHGSPASRLLRDAKKGTPVCVTVTLMDGLVMARSVFHHSFNFRSVVVLGKALEITEDAEKTKALEALVEHIVPGRVSEARPPNEREHKGTTVLKLSLAEASAKIRTGPPKDDEEDYELDVWAGVIPLRTAMGEPETDPDLKPGVPMAESARNYAKRLGGASG